MIIYPHGNALRAAYEMARSAHILNDDLKRKYIHAFKVRPPLPPPSHLGI